MPYRTIDSDASPDLLMQILNGGERIDAPLVGGLTPASIALRNGVYIMYGVSGSHALPLGITSAERLHAHWQGFKEVAAASLRKEHA